jgi:adenylylsulfate kinase
MIMQEIPKEEKNSSNVVWHDHVITRNERESFLGQKGVLLWLTGLSGSGKSTIASIIEKKLHDNGKLCYILDGDNIRHGLNSDLGFSEEDRKENIRRVGEVAKLFVDAGIIVITAFISPFKEDRDSVRKKIGKDFKEIYIRCDIKTCEKRDPKGLYKKARSGDIKEFTGVSQDYEEPENPEMTIDSDKISAEDSVNMIIKNLF